MAEQQPSAVPTDDERREILALADELSAIPSDKIGHETEKQRRLLRERGWIVDGLRLLAERKA